MSVTLPNKLSVGTQISPGTSQSSPGEADWRRIKPIFEQLYIQDDLSLKEVVLELRQKHSFKASEQMYKKRIKRWGLGKNLKQHEVEHILGTHAMRRALGKETYFYLRDRKVSMQTVHRFQQHKKLSTSQAISNFLAGRSGECRNLRAYTPQGFDSVPWKTPDQPYEDTLRAFGLLFDGLVDIKYYWIESDEIIMTPSVLRGEVSDVCSSLAAMEDNVLNMIVVRKLALLLESIVRSHDAWTHCRLIYMLWVLSSRGHVTIAKALLTQLNRLINSTANRAYAQSLFVRHYSNLEVAQASKLAADMISLKAQMVDTISIQNPSAFKLRSLEYDVFWRRREQGAVTNLSDAVDLLMRCHDTLGLLAVETLAVLRIILDDFDVAEIQLPRLLPILKNLQTTEQLAFSNKPPLFTLAGQPMSLEATAELACVYCKLELHDAEAWIFKRLFSHYKQTQSCLRREYSLLIHLAGCKQLQINPDDENRAAWTRRKHDMENRWQLEVEAVAPTMELLMNI